MLHEELRAVEARGVPRVLPGNHEALELDEAQVEGRPTMELQSIEDRGSVVELGMKQGGVP